MSPARVPPRPGRKCLPQYLLRCTSGWFDGHNYAGCYYSGRDPSTTMPIWLRDDVDPLFAGQMCGAGLASAGL